MTAIQFLIFLIVGLAILIVILVLGLLWCRRVDRPTLGSKDQPCRLLRSIWSKIVQFFVVSGKGG